MATMMLTAAGTAVGGPLGGALGSLVGQAIDTQFGSGPRRGPRLDDLRLQTSSYGMPIPRIYGRMRVAGTVIWATDLEESENLEGGGKGSAEVVQYAYACSFAVALSSRPIMGVGRIWADGKLIRGAAGDLKLSAKLRILDGGEDQPVDPLIAALEGAGGTPAYRGLALAVFEDMALAEFGNRIPVLTFEVIADDKPVDAADIIVDCAAGAVDRGRGTATAALVGYAAFGSDQRAAVESLAELASVRIRCDEGLGIANGEAPISLPGDEALGWSAHGQPGPALGAWRQEPARALPAALAIRYHEPERDYQAGQMQADMPGGRGELVLDSAAAMSGVDARQMALRALARRWAGRDRVRLRLGPERLAIGPGDALELGWRSGLWLVEEATIDGLAVVIDCCRLAEGGVSAVADPGRSSPQADEPIGESRLALLDLPDLGDNGDGRLRLHVAVSCAGGFRPVPLTTNVACQPGTSLVAARRARLGIAASVLAPAPATVVDAASVLDVTMIEERQLLLHADDQALDGGANLAMVGSELIQFGRADPIGPGQYRLSRLLRGRRGTEWAIQDHRLGESFVMIDRGALLAVDLDTIALGQAIEVAAHGGADDPASLPTATRRAGGEALRPLAPCKLVHDGGSLRWVRRSRRQWAWIDGEPGEESGVRFSVLVTGAAGTISRTVGDTQLVLSPEDYALLGSGPAVAWIAEIGPWQPSAAARLEFVLP